MIEYCIVKTKVNKISRCVWASAYMLDGRLKELWVSHRFFPTIHLSFFLESTLFLPSSSSTSFSSLHFILTRLPSWIFLFRFVFICPVDLFTFSFVETCLSCHKLLCIRFLSTHSKYLDDIHPTNLTSLFFLHLWSFSLCFFFDSSTPLHHLLLPSAFASFHLSSIPSILLQSFLSSFLIFFCPLFTTFLLFRLLFDLITGSLQKVDATYLSPHVNMAARLETASKQYGTHSTPRHVIFCSVVSCHLTTQYVTSCIYDQVFFPNLINYGDVMYR